MRQVKEVEAVDIITVKSIDFMTTAHFARHMSRRHRDSLGGLPTLPENMEWTVEQNYRAWHRRLHGLYTKSQLLHDHEPGDLAQAIDFALKCIIENRDWYWKEIAGVSGLFAAFPDGRIATRVGGRVKYHNSIEDATDRLINATAEWVRVSHG